MDRLFLVMSRSLPTQFMDGTREPRVVGSLFACLRWCELQYGLTKEQYRELENTGGVDTDSYEIVIYLVDYLED